MQEILFIAAVGKLLISVMVPAGLPFVLEAAAVVPSTASAPPMLPLVPILAWWSQAPVQSASPLVALRAPVTSIPPAAGSAPVSASPPRTVSHPPMGTLRGMWGLGRRCHLFLYLLGRLLEIKLLCTIMEVRLHMILESKNIYCRYSLTRQQIGLELAMATVLALRKLLPSRVATWVLRRQLRLKGWISEVAILRWAMK